MKTNTLQRKTQGIGLALSLLFGFILLTGMNVQAQNRYPDNRDDQYNRQQNDRNGDYNRRNNDDNRRNGDYNRNGGYNNGGYYNNSSRIAVQQGLRDGLNKGADDARNRNRFNPERTREYKKATNGYNSYYGNKDAYRDSYREGFLRGYRQGFDRNNRYDNGGYGRGY